MGTEPDSSNTLPAPTPVIGYAGHNTPSAAQVAREMRRSQRKPLPPELKAVISIVVVTIIGGCVGEPMSAGAILPIIGFAIWYIHERVQRRKRTPRCIRQLMLTSAISALFFTVPWTITLVADKRGGNWIAYVRWPSYCLLSCLALFAFAEMAALIHWIRNRNRPTTATTSPISANATATPTLPPANTPS